MFNNDSRKKSFKKVKKDFGKKQIKSFLLKTHNHLTDEEIDMISKFPQLDPNIVPESLALVVDGYVADIIKCHERLAKILLDDVKIVQIPRNINVKPGWGYDSNGFVETVTEYNTQSN